MRPPAAVCLRWCVSGVQGALRGRALALRCARECLHAMCVGAMVCMEMCARNRARLCCCAEAAACGEVERGMEMGRTCMRALATHPLTPLPASVRRNRSRLGRTLP
jgi:hypothetical protein